MLSVAFCVVLTCTWVAASRSESWRRWLPKMEFSSTDSKHFSKAFDKPDYSDEMPSYLGRGKADLGNFSVLIFNPASRTRLRTDFRLEGRTVYENKQQFDEFVKHNHRFFREQVMVTLRNCEPADLADPRFRMLEKKLIARVNRTLGKPLLKSVEVKDFVLLESVARSSFVERDPTGMATTP